MSGPGESIIYYFFVSNILYYFQNKKFPQKCAVGFQTQSLKIQCLLCFADFESTIIPADIYLFEVNNGSIRTMCEICSELTIKTPERRHDVVLMPLLLTLNISHIVLVFPSSTLNQKMPVGLRHWYPYQILIFFFYFFFFFCIIIYIQDKEILALFLLKITNSGQTLLKEERIVEKVVFLLLQTFE